MEKDIILEKSKNLSVRIIKLYRYLKDEKDEHSMSDNIFRHTLDIGMNIISGTKSSTVAKVKASEYWLDVLYRTKFIDKQSYEAIDKDLKELLELINETNF